jgi:hypothetical protein
VIARYGPVDFEAKNRSLPEMLVMSRDRGKHWYTVLVFPTISFISPGKRKPGEDLLLRPVTGIWLENQN